MTLLEDESQEKDDSTFRLQADFKMKKCLTRILNLGLSYKIAETVVTFLISWLKLTMSLDSTLSFAKDATFVRHTILFYQMVTQYFKTFLSCPCIHKNVAYTYLWCTCIDFR